MDLPIGAGCEDVYLVIKLASGVKMKADWVSDAPGGYNSYGFSPIINSAQANYRLSFRSLLAQSVELTPFLITTAGGNSSTPLVTGPYWTEKRNCITVAPATSSEMIPAGSKFTWAYR